MLKQPNIISPPAFKALRKLRNTKTDSVNYLLKINFPFGRILNIPNGQITLTEMSRETHPDSPTINQIRIRRFKLLPLWFKIPLQNHFTTPIALKELCQETVYQIFAHTLIKLPFPNTDDTFDTLPTDLHKHKQFFNELGFDDSELQDMQSTKPEHLQYLQRRDRQHYLEPCTQS